MSSEPDKFVQEIFSEEVSSTYETVNHVLTMGLDVLWRKRVARMAAAAGGTEWADVCTGTGETAFYLSRLAKPGTKVYAVDFSKAMLNEAKKKAADNLSFILSDVKNLAFPDNSLDMITISFATRNLNLKKEMLRDTLAEFCRVLKPGGRFLNLETSQPSFEPLRKVMHAYVKLVVKPAGGIISGSYKGYAYLRHTIPLFYPPEELSEIMRDAGFADVTCKRLMWGMAAIHQGLKK